MDAMCKFSQRETTWPCAARTCPLLGDCLTEWYKHLQQNDEEQHQ